METLEELDWCLDQLESMQTHRSVSDMASNKVTILRDFVTYLIFTISKLQYSVLNQCLLIAFINALFYAQRLSCLCTLRKTVQTVNGMGLCFKIFFEFNAPVLPKILSLE